MAILTHHSFPDEEEVANGVGTTSIDGKDAHLVSQPGAASVTNPDSSKRPEIAIVRKSFGFTSVNIFQKSEIAPLGRSILENNEYKSLFELFSKVRRVYQQQVDGSNAAKFDFEYNKIRPNNLVVKQIREIPRPSAGSERIIIGKSAKYCPRQGG